MIRTADYDIERLHHVQLKYDHTVDYWINSAFKLKPEILNQYGSEAYIYLEWFQLIKYLPWLL